MMNQCFLFLIINIIILFSTFCDAQNACQNATGNDCQTCVNAGECGYCKSTKVCFTYGQNNLIRPPCDTSDMQYKTCVGSFQVWIIIVIVVVGIVVIAILVVICCLCRKCKRCRIRKEEKRQEVDTQRMEERRAAAEVRSTERNLVADKIRMKYGILKEKENGTDYTRMS